MMETDVNEDPSVGLTRLAESLQELHERPDRWGIFRRVATVGALVIVIVTCAMVGFVVYQQATSSENAAVTSCRSEYAADVQVGVANAFASLARSAVQSDDDEFDRQLLTAANDLVTRAESYQKAAVASKDAEQFLKDCEKR